MRKNRLLIVLFTGVAVLLSLASCTYDYFEDETNYQVFVPEVLNKTVSDCRVLVYNDAGTLAVHVMQPLHGIKIRAWRRACLVLG